MIPRRAGPAMSRSWKRTALVLLGASFSVGMFYWTQLSMLTYPGWRWASFRIFGSGDQLSYFAEVVNGSHGNLAAVEPFTETGSNSDPHLYYQILGAIAHDAGVNPADVWNITGVALQVVLVVCISLGAAAITRRWWATSLGAIPFLVGTLSFTSQGWFTPMQSHAVLWGSFAVMFPLNSESASLAIAGSLFIMLLVVATQRPSPRALLLAGTVTGAGIGLLANFHTYGFLTAFFLGIYCLAAYAISVSRLWKVATLSAILVLLLFLVGPPFASSAGRLAALALAIVPAAPGVVVAMVRWRARVIAPLVATVVTASPQVAGTWLALQSGNAFLKYREASSAGLGVTWKDGLFCALPLVIPLLTILLAGIHRNRPIWIAYSVGSIAAWIVLAKNDVWGTNQEPYRFWIDSFALIAFSIVPIALDVILTYLGRGARPDRCWRLAVASLASATLVVGAWSGVDWYRFYKSQEDQTISLATAPDQAMKQVMAAATNRDLVLTDPCTDGQIFKAVTGAPVATFSPGLAWPARVKQITRLEKTLVTAGTLTPAQLRPVDRLTPAELRAAQVGWIVTDGTCAADWPEVYSKILTKAAVAHYGPSPLEVISLWRVDAAP
ncbi:MAG: putative integral rane protein [Acidimicrobiaceae bacterium]|nr:putative integral rane protein [Acidimicrobiaceae bacterium]